MGVTKNWLDYVNRVTTLRGQVRRVWNAHLDDCGDNTGIYGNYCQLQKDIEKEVRAYKAFCKRKGYRFIRDDVKPLIPAEFTASETEWGFNRFEMETLLRVADCMDPMPFDEFPHFWKAFNDIYKGDFTPARAANQIAYLAAHGRTYNN